jgi:hypothetical protein
MNIHYLNIGLASLVLAVTTRADLVGHWTLDESPAANAGTVADISGGINVHDGLINTTLEDAAVTGIIGGAFDFTKSGSDYVVADLETDFVLGAGPATISFWMNPDTADGQNFVFAWGSNSTGQNVRVTVETLGGNLVLRQRHQGGFVEFDASAMTLENGWHHVAAVVPDGLNPLTATVSDVVFYLNGTEMTTLVDDNDTLDVRAGTGGTNVFIGSNWNGATAFDGQLDDVGWWNEALTAEQITTIYNGGLAGNNLQEALGGFTASPFAITEIQLLPDDMVKLTWNSKSGAVYSVFWSTDLTNFDADAADDIDSQGDTTTYIVDSLGAPTATAPRLFFRVGENE